MLMAPGAGAAYEQVTWGRRKTTCDSPLDPTRCEPVVQIRGSRLVSYSKQCGRGLIEARMMMNDEREKALSLSA